MWLTFAPVPSLTAEYYQVTLSDVDWFSQSYFVASLLIGFIAIGVLDVFGLRIAVSITYAQLCIVITTCMFIVEGS